MHHTAAYFDATDSTTLGTQIAAIADDGILSRRNNNFFPTRNLDLVYAYAGGDGAVQIELFTPSMRSIAAPSLVPLNVADQPGDNPSIVDYRANPIRIPGGQELRCQGGGDTGNEPIVCIIGLQENFTPAPAGNIHTIRATSTSTLVAATWTFATLTFADTLPPGRYAVVGAYAQSATGIAFRLVLPGQVYRPGGLVATTVRQDVGKMFLKGGLGKWGEFSNDALPELQMFATAGDTAATLFLDIIRM